MTQDAQNNGTNQAGAAEDRKETLQKLLARKTEFENMAQAFAVAGMEMPAGSEEEYARLKDRIKQLES